MKTIGAYEILDHGIEHSQYFQGCGTSFTEYVDVATGIGDNAYEALEDALESLAQGEWSVDAIANRYDENAQGICQDCEHYGKDDNDDVCEGCELHYHVSVRVR